MPDIVMPQSVEAEKAILGAILLDNHAYLEASEGLSSDDFSRDSHRRIFARMVSLMETRRSVDIVTLVDELDTHKDLQAVGDVAYISSLLDGVPDRPSILSYVQIVREKAMLRRLIHASQAAIERACLQQGDALTILADAESAIAHITAKPKSDAKSLRELMVPTLDQMSKERNRETEFIGIPTGIPDLDLSLGGMRPSELWIAGGLSARGKTSFGVQFAMNAIKMDYPTIDFSLEMKDWQVVRRILASHTPAGATGARDPRLLSDEKWNQVLRARLATGSPTAMDRRFGQPVPARAWRQNAALQEEIRDQVGTRRLPPAGEGAGPGSARTSDEHRRGTGATSERGGFEYCGTLAVEQAKGH